MADRSRSSIIVRNSSGDPARVSGSLARAATTSSSPAPGRICLGQRLHLGPDLHQVVPAPAVGLGRGRDRCPRNDRAWRRYRSAPTPSAVGRTGQVLLLEPAGHVLDRLLRRRRARRGAPRTGRCRRPRCSLKLATSCVKRALGADRGPQLFDGALGLTLRRPPVRGHALLEAGAEAGQRAADRGRAGWRCCATPPRTVVSMIANVSRSSGNRPCRWPRSRWWSKCSIGSSERWMCSPITRTASAAHAVLGRRQRVERGPLLAEEGGHRGHAGR